MTDHETKPEPRQRFGRIPADLDIATLNCGERGVLIVIAQHVRRKTSDSSSPGVATIASRTGLSRRGVQYAIRKLERKGILHVDRGGGRGTPNRYTLIVKGATQSAPINPAKGAVQSAPINPPKGCSLRRERVQYQAVKGATQSAPEDRSKDRKKDRPAARATAENIQGGKQKQSADCELLNALRDRGIGEPMCSRLASNPALTLAMVETTQGAGGALVENLREAIVKQSEIDERDRKRTEAQAREDSERRRASLVVESEAQAAETVLSRYTDQQQAEAFGIMVSAPMPHQTRTWLLCTVPPGMLARQLDADGYEREYRKLLGLPDQSPEEPQESMFPGKMLRD